MLKKLLSFSCIAILLAILAAVSYGLISFTSNGKLIDSSLNSLLHNSQSSLGRIERFNSIREREFFVVLADKNDDYAQILKAATKLRALEGISWYTHGSGAEGYLTFYKAESYYRNPKITGITDESSLVAHLEAETQGLSKEELEKQAQTDPFGFKRNFIMPPFKGTEDNLFYLEAKDGNALCGKVSKCYVLHGFAEAETGVFTNEGEVLIAKLDQATLDLSQNGGSVIYFGGILEHNSFLSLLLNDISLIWGCAIAAIFLLFILIFKSIRPFIELVLLGSLSLIIGGLATLLYMGSIHLLTITLVAPVLGIISDIYLYFCTDRDKGESISKVRISLLCLAITALTYCFMAMTGLIIFKELAMIAIISLVVFFCIIYGLLAWLKPISNAAVYRTFAKISLNSIPLYGKLCSFVVVFAMIAAAIYGFSVAYVSVNTTPQSFLNHKLVSKSNEFRSLMYNNTKLSFFTVSADTVNLLATRLDKIDGYLAASQDKKMIAGYFSYKDTLIPSAEAMANAAFYEKLLPVAKEFYKKKGINIDPVIPRFVHVPAVEFLKAETTDNYPFVLDRSTKPFISIVTVAGMSESDIDRFLRAYPYVESTDMAKTYSYNLSYQRNDVIIVLILMSAALFTLVFVCSGINGTLGIILPAFVGTGIACWYMVLMAIPLSLYTLVALLLVIGVSTDCALFIRQLPKLGDRRAFLTVILAFLVSQVLFGLLAFSKLPNIADIGRVVFVGLIAAIICGIIMNLVIVLPRRVK